VVRVGGVLYDLAVSHRVCGSVDAGGKMYAAGAAKNRPSVCCPMGVVFHCSAGPPAPASALILRHVSIFIYAQ
jgi:hypothetical protein